MNKENILVYGSGARDHCLCEEYAESPHVNTVFFVPGNPGVKYTGKGKTGHIIQVPEIRDVDDVAKFGLENNVRLVDAGSENCLSEGLIDRLEEAGIPCIGPKQKYVRIESDREFTDKSLDAMGIPKPEWKSFTNPEEAKKYIRNIGYQVVVKANGLAAGKGSIVCDDVDDALKAIDTIMINKKFGKSGEKVIIEERKYGTEISFYAYLDREHVLPLKMFAQDYKPAFDQDDKENIKLLEGNLNTGGTGCYCPHKLLEQQGPRITNKIIKEIVNPTADWIYNKLGWDYKGVLYFGLNYDNIGDNVDVFEINVRHGDPEAEVLLRKFQIDFYELGRAVVEGKLDDFKPRWNPNYYVDVIAMTGKSKGEKGKGWYPGYPGRYGKGYEIQGINDMEKGIALFYAGVDEKNGKLVTSGGRVLHVIASSKNNLEEAVNKAYKNIEKIKFIDHNNNNENCMRYRRTIGKN